MSAPSLPNRRILDLCRDCPPGLGDLARRRHFDRELPPELAREACAQLALRERARGRLPAHVEWWLHPKGLAQATRWPVAVARARELDARLTPGARVWDATCGLGVDALALAERERLLAASDRAIECSRAARFHLEQRGAGERVLLAEALSDAVHAELAFVDPDRRASGRRTLDPAAFQPELRTLVAAARARAGLVCKLPGSFDPATLERAAPGDVRASWRWTSHAGELCELSWWTGIARASRAEAREAECIDSAGTSHLYSAAHDVQARCATRAEALAAPFLCESDPTLTCSGLLGAFARDHELALVGPCSGFLIAPQAVGSAFVGCWRVIESCSADERVVRAMLQRRDIGSVDVKVRGHALGAAELARRLHRGSGARGLLAIARLEDGHAAFLLAAREPEARAPGGAEPILSRSQ